MTLSCLAVGTSVVFCSVNTTGAPELLCNESDSWEILGWNCPQSLERIKQLRSAGEGSRGSLVTALDHARSRTGSKLAINEKELAACEQVIEFLQREILSIKD